MIYVSISGPLGIISVIIFIYFRIVYYNASYVYQLYFHFAYFLDESERGGPGLSKSI
jgi:hypothetical protein